MCAPSAFFCCSNGYSKAQVSHFLAFRHAGTNKVFGIFSNLPLTIPAFMCARRRGGIFCVRHTLPDDMAVCSSATTTSTTSSRCGRGLLVRGRGFSVLVHQ